MQNNEEALGAMDNDDEMLMQALQMSLAGGGEVGEDEEEAVENEEEDVDYRMDFLKVQIQKGELWSF